MSFAMAQKESAQGRSVISKSRSAVAVARSPVTIVRLLIIVTAEESDFEIKGLSGEQVIRVKRHVIVLYVDDSDGQRLP
jgi:hypothetical protein